MQVSEDPASRMMRTILSWSIRL